MSSVSVSVPMWSSVMLSGKAEGPHDIKEQDFWYPLRCREDRKECACGYKLLIPMGDQIRLWRGGRRQGHMHM